MSLETRVKEALSLIAGDVKALEDAVPGGVETYVLPFSADPVAAATAAGIPPGSMVWMQPS